MNGDDDVFADALPLPPAQRSAFLDMACAGDAAQRARIESLLAGYIRAEEILNSPPVGRFEMGGEEKIGSLIGRYKLVEKIGEGGCGAVWMAEQEEPVRRRVALKVIKLGMDTKEVIARFEAERQALALMDHPNIAKIFDAGATQAGRPFFVMELVGGIPITRFCDEGSLPTRQRLNLFIQVCHAIQHAHQKGVIHRDIKPSNILVAVYDHIAIPKVIDFGIAKATHGRLTDKTLVTGLAQFIGTPAYMSPEQVEYNALDVDTRSDVYSLGVLLYELLTGRPPFDPKALVAGGLDQIRRIIREVDPPRPSLRLDTLVETERTTLARQRGIAAIQHPTLLRGDLDWIAMHCLEKDRTRRYETADGLASDLQRHLDNEPVLARPPSAAYRFRKAFRRNKLIFVAATAVAVTLVGGFAVSTWQMLEARRAQQETEVARHGEQSQRIEAQAAQKIAATEARKAAESEQHARRLLYVSDMNLAQQTLKLNNLGNARRLLDRHRPVPGEEDLRGWEWRYLWQITRASASTRLDHRPDARGCSVSFSPDGTRVAVGWIGGRVDLWDVPGRRLIRAVAGRDYEKHQGRVAFSPVRNLLAATPEPKVVTLYDLDSGRESILWRAPDGAEWKIREISFSPDGSKALIYTRFPRTHDEVWVVNVASAQVESRHKTDWTSSENSVLGGTRISSDNQRLYLTHRDSIRCVDLGTGNDLWKSESEKVFGISGIALSPDGRLLASCAGHDDPTIRVRDAATGRMLQRLSGHSASVRHVAFSHDGRSLLSAGADQTIRFWDTEKWIETKALSGHTDEVRMLAVSGSARLVASTGDDGTLMLWRLDEPGVAATYRRLTDRLDGDRVWPLEDGRVLVLQQGKQPEVLDLRGNSPPATLLDMGSSDDVLGWFASNPLCHWNGSSIIVRELRGTELFPRGVLTPDSGARPDWVVVHPGRQLIAWSDRKTQGSIFLESLVTPGRRTELKSDAPGVLIFLFSEDGRSLAAWGYKALRVWQVDTGRIVLSSSGDVKNAFFAADARVLVVFRQTETGSEIEFHDLTQPGGEPRRFAGTSASRGQAMSRRAGMIAFTGRNSVRIFDPARGEPIGLPLEGHLNSVYGVDFSPDERRVITSASVWEAVKLWDIVTRQELLSLGGVGSILWHAKWTADGNSILAGPPWQSWTAPSWEEIAAAEAKEKAENRSTGRN